MGREKEEGGDSGSSKRGAEEPAIPAVPPGGSAAASATEGAPSAPAQPSPPPPSAPAGAAETGAIGGGGGGGGTRDSGGRGEGGSGTHSPTQCPFPSWDRFRPIFTKQRRGEGEQGRGEGEGKDGRNDDEEEMLSRFAAVESDLEARWETECGKYEESVDVDDVDEPCAEDEEERKEKTKDKKKMAVVPRRNYANAAGVVRDPTLFPYHTSLYPLLDCYDYLYEEEEEEGTENGIVGATEVEDQQAQGGEGGEGGHRRRSHQQHSHPRHPVEVNSVPPSVLPMTERAYRLKYVDDDQDENDDEDRSFDVVDIEDFLKNRLEGYTPVSVQSTLSALIQHDYCRLPKEVAVAARDEEEDDGGGGGEEEEAEEGEGRQYDCSGFFNLLQIALDRCVDARLRSGPPGGPDPGGENGGGGVLPDLVVPGGGNGNERKEKEGPDEEVTAPAAAAAAHEMAEKRDWRYGPKHLPADRKERSIVLMKVLKHSLSELQRDLRLSSAVTVRLAIGRDFDDPETLREFLITCRSEYTNCSDGACEFGPDTGGFSDGGSSDGFSAGTGPGARLVDHYCFERQAFDEIVVQSLAVGMTRVTEEHASVLAGFARYGFHGEFGHLMLSESGKKGVDVATRGRLRLKRQALARHAENDVEVDFTSPRNRKVPVDLVDDVVHALGIRGFLERKRLLQALGSDGDDEDAGGGGGGGGRGQEAAARDEIIAQSFESYQNCLRALVDIAASVHAYLPGSDRFYGLASSLARAIACSLADVDEKHIMPSDNDDDDDDHDGGDDDDDDDDDSSSDDDSPPEPDYMGFDQNLREKRLCSDFRYAEWVTNASDVLRKLDHPQPDPAASNHEQLLAAIRKYCLGRPHDYVREAVRGLFARDLVDVRSAGIGYGDFLVFCRLVDSSSPLDPALFWHETNYPVEEEYSDEEEDDEEFVNYDDRSVDWEKDEDDHYLTEGELRARHDFSLTLLVRALRSPWTPQSHKSFPLGFQQAAFSVMLATHRLAMPKDVGHRINEFLNREWWHNERMMCWNQACQKSHDPEGWLVGSDGSAPRNLKRYPTLTACPHCDVAVYCSEECRQMDWKESHKQFCNVPPCRVPTSEEEVLIKSVTGSTSGSQREASLTQSTKEKAGDSALAEDDVAEEDVDDDEGWEDIDSDDDEGSNAEPLSKTREIYKFYKDNAYTQRGIGMD